MPDKPSTPEICDRPPARARQGLPVAGRDGPAARRR